MAETPAPGISALTVPLKRWCVESFEQLAAIDAAGFQCMIEWWIDQTGTFPHTWTAVEIEKLLQELDGCSKEPRSHGRKKYHGLVQKGVQTMVSQLAQKRNDNNCLQKFDEWAKLDKDIMEEIDTFLEENTALHTSSNKSIKAELRVWGKSLLRKWYGLAQLYADVFPADYRKPATRDTQGPPFPDMSITEDNVGGYGVSNAYAQWAYAYQGHHLSTEPIGHIDDISPAEVKERSSQVAFMRNRLVNVVGNEMIEAFPRFKRLSRSAFHPFFMHPFFEAKKEKARKVQLDLVTQDPGNRGGTREILRFHHAALVPFLKFPLEMTVRQKEVLFKQFPDLLPNSNMEDDALHANRSEEDRLIT